MSETIELPAFVDLHVHLREPSDNKSETIENGTRAAMLGGFALVCDMPNNPGHPTWSFARLLEKRKIAGRTARIPVLFYSGSQPESDNIHELEAMSARSVGLKLYGAPTTGNENDYVADDFEPIVKEWSRVAPRKPIMFHAGKENLEDMLLMVAGENEQPFHVCHVNDPGDVEMIVEAKENGLPVTCGVCPHHLFKTSHDVETEGWFARMQPPLARQVDSEELWSMLVKGKIDIIETDYAPHSKEAKMKAEAENPEGIHDAEHTTCFGVPGIEHVAPLLFRQVKLGRISMERLVEVLSTKPQEIIRKKMRGPTTKWEMTDFRIDDEEHHAKSGAGWTPYLGMLGTGILLGMKINGHHKHLK